MYTETKYHNLDISPFNIKNTFKMYEKFRKLKLTYYLSAHRDISIDTASMQHTSTYVLNTFIKKYHSQHAKNTSPLIF